MLISVSHSMATLSLQTHIIHWRMSKKLIGKCNYMEQDSTKNHLVLAKTGRVSKYTLSVLKVCYLQHKYNDSSKKNVIPSYFSHAFEK